MAAPNFELLSDISTTTRRDFLADETTASLNPLDANPLVDGEWVEITDAGKVGRGTGSGRACVYPVYAEKGRYDVQALRKVPVLMLHEYEAETTICDPASPLAVGDMLKVGTVLTNKRGILRATGGVGASGEVIVGICTKLFSGLNKLRFQRIPPQKLP